MIVEIEVVGFEGEPCELGWEIQRSVGIMAAFRLASRRGYLLMGWFIVRSAVTRNEELKLVAHFILNFIVSFLAL